MTDAAPYTVPKEPGRWRALMLAAAVHAMLLGFLWFGVRWQNQTPVAVEAEVWSLQPREAAPRPQPVPQPEPPQVVKPEPKSEPRQEPKPQPEAKPEVKPEPKPDIALEQEKKRREKERQEKLAREREEKLAQLKIEEKRLEEKRRAEKEKADKAEKAEAARKLAEAEALKKAEAAKKAEVLKKAEAAKKAEELKKAAAEKQRKEEAAEAEQLAKARDQEMRRISGGLTGTGGAGDAPKSQGSGRADTSYTQRVGAKIKSNTVYDVPDGLAGNPAVEYQVELLPDGSLRSARKLKSSGIPGFDAAVLRAIERSQPYPPDKSGSVPSGFTLSHKPKDQ